MKSRLQKLSLNLDGTLHEGYGSFHDGTYWFHLEGTTYTVLQKSKSKRGKQSRALQNPGKIAAPMPGKIIKVIAGVGQDIKEHQVILVMEAMKMEYTLKARAAGVVSALKCAVGEQVQLGQVLATIDVAPTTK